MTITVLDIYSVRFEPKIPLPKSLQDNIARLRITPAVYKPVRSFTKKYNRHHNSSNNKNTTNSNIADSTEDWRQKALEDIVQRVHERKDPEYSDIFSIFNKLTITNLDKLSHDALEVMQKQDETFRLRVTTLLFNRAITQSAYSGIMAECAFRLNTEIPEISEDLQVQISMFPKLYDMTETLNVPISTDENYNEKIIAWTKQKDTRRGYAKFMMELFAKELISETPVRGAFEQVVKELKELIVQPASSATTENTFQLIEFIFECSKTVKGELKEYLKNAVQEILKVSKEEFKTTYPSVNMKSKFKLEDALKLLDKKE